MKKAIITGIAGQDGAFLAQLLINKGYNVIGADRRRVDSNYPRLRDLGIENKIEFRYFDLLEDSIIYDLVRKEQPDEFYNLAAQSFVKASFDLPLLTADIDAMGVLRILEAIRTFSPKTKFYQASTSEMFGKVQEVPQTEKTPFYPRSPYGVAKLFAHWIVKNYRESYSLFACSGILFNHESEYRGKEFVTQKIVEKAVSISNGDETPLVLGNIDAQRDWGYAKDYTEGMYMMLQSDKPDDYVLATNQTTTVRDFVSKVFKEVGISLKWSGTGIDEKGINVKTNKVMVEISEQYYRPAEVDLLIGDYSKARKELGWEPRTNLDKLVSIMVDHAKLREEIQKK
jgi:GDPmannose 4,6-dehydratase